MRFLIKRWRSKNFLYYNVFILLTLKQTTFIKKFIFILIFGFITII